MISGEIVHSKTDLFLLCNKKKISFELCLAFVFYVLLAFLFFPKISSEVYIGLGDGWSQFYSRYAFFKQTIQDGVFPWWNPLVLCGVPSGLDAVSDFSLVNVLLLFLSLNTAWNVHQFLTPVISAWFVFLILRKQFYLSVFSAFLGGLILLANTVSLAPDNPAYFLLPLMFFLTHQWIEKERWVFAFLVSLTLSYYFLNANAQYVLYAAFFLWLYAFAGLWRKERGKCSTKAANIFLRSCTPFLFAFGMSAFHVFRVYELLSVSHRGIAVKEYVHMLVPADVVLFFYRNFYMSSARPELNFLLPKMVKSIVDMISSNNILQIRPPYIGIFPLMFGFSMFFKKEKTHTEAFLLAFSAGILVYLMVNPILHPIVKLIPIVNKLPAIWRVYNLYYLCMAILGAIFFDRLCRRSFQDEFSSKKIYRGASVLLAVLICVFVLRFVAHILLSFWNETLLTYLQQTLLPRILKNPRFTASPEFYLGRIEQILVALHSWTSFGNTYFLLTTFLWVASLSLFRKALVAQISKRRFVVIMCCLLLLDFNVHMKAEASFPPGELRPFEQEAAYLSRQEGLFRVMPIQPATDEKNPPLLDVRVDTRKVIMRPETNLIYGLGTPEAYRSLIPSRYADFVELFTGKPLVRWLVGEFEHVNEAYADLMNVKYILTTAKQELGEGYQKVYESRGRSIFFNEDALERAFLVYGGYNYKDSALAFQALKENKTDFSSEAILNDKNLPEGEHTFGRFSENDQVRMIHYGPNKVDLQIYSEYGGLLILTDTDFPGWKATVDGQPQAIWNANYVFRAVAISPGNHRVRFVYQPESLQVGVRVSGMSLASGICVLIFLVFKGWCRRPARDVAAVKTRPVT